MKVDKRGREKEADIDSKDRRRETQTEVDRRREADRLIELHAHAQRNIDSQKYANRRRMTQRDDAVSYIFTTVFHDGFLYRYTYFDRHKRNGNSETLTYTL